MDASNLDEEAVALADPRRLRQVLINVVSNAIKYNRPDGSLGISVARRAGAGQGTGDPGPAQAVIIVRDTGLGIPDDVADRLFTPFDRLGAERFAEPGSGLGLVVSDRLVAAMGGTLRGAQPTRGRARPSRSPSRRGRRPNCPAGDGRRRAPDADDGRPPTGRRCAGACSTSRTTPPIATSSPRSCEPVRVSSCARARTGSRPLERARAAPPDLVLLDLDLPDVTGEDLVAAMRGGRRARGRPGRRAQRPQAARAGRSGMPGQAAGRRRPPVRPRRAPDLPVAG